MAPIILKHKIDEYLLIIVQRSNKSSPILTNIRSLLTYAKELGRFHFYRVGITLLQHLVRFINVEISLIRLTQRIKIVDSTEVHMLLEKRIV